MRERRFSPVVIPGERPSCGKTPNRRPTAEECRTGELQEKRDAKLLIRLIARAPGLTLPEKNALCARVTEWATLGTVYALDPETRAAVLAFARGAA